jgi:hypothetical protein
MRTPTGNPNGRPRKPITLAQVEKLFALGCTQPEVAAFFGVSVDTLQRRDGFAATQERGLANGKISLRRAQMKAALAGNSRLLTWMGMQMLNQANRTSAELTGPNGGPLQTQDLTRLNDADLDNLESILSKTAAADSGAGQGRES